MKYSAVVEIATGINALAMTVVVDGRQHLTDRATNCNLIFIDVSELFVGTPADGCPPGRGAVLHRTTKHVIPRER